MEVVSAAYTSGIELIQIMQMNKMDNNTEIRFINASLFMEGAAQFFHFSIVSCFLRFFLL